MSFYDDQNDASKEEYYSEFESSIFKLSAPIGRGKYFWVLLFLTIISLGFLLFAKNFLVGFTFLRGGFSFIILLFLSFVLMGIYISFINLTCRLWDVMGSLRNAVITTILILLLNIFLPDLLRLAVFIVPAFLPGKLLK